MEEIEDTGESQGQGKLVPLRINPDLSATSFSRSTPPRSSSFCVSHLCTLPRRGPRVHVSFLRWIRSKRLFPWLVIISVWSYVGFHIQSKWTFHQEDDNGFHVHEVFDPNAHISIEDVQILDKKSQNSSGRQKIKDFISHIDTFEDQMNDIVRGIREISEGIETSNSSLTVSSYGTPTRDTPYGRIIGPFGKIENSILNWNSEKRPSTCDAESLLAQAVRAKSFILIFHELSLTGAPLSMMELAIELSNCGGKVTAVALSKKGGLMRELLRHRIKVLKDKRRYSYKAASKADFVIAGSAVCASWIENYLLRDGNGGSRIIWWIMENRRLYFDKSKHLLSKVKMILFLSQSQSKQWLAWCKEEKIHLNSSPELVPLSLNDELAFAAGIPSTLNTPSSPVEKMMEKRLILRGIIRSEMGLTDSEMLVMTLSSINPGKGQYLLLQSASLLFRNLSGRDIKKKISTINENLSIVTGRKENLPMKRTRGFRAIELHNQSSDVSSTWIGYNSQQKNFSFSIPLSQSHDRRHHKKVLLENSNLSGAPKILIGSLGCKSNKELYIKGMLKFLSQQPELTKALLWTPTTTHVASLYAAADVYVINAQGLGETFGRVTIEAMAFGLPILGTDAGGTHEIVEHDVSGLLHPPGQKGVPTLARNLEYLLLNPSARHAMGAEGRKKVQNMFLKSHMYHRIAEVLQQCMKTK